MSIVNAVPTEDVEAVKSDVSWRCCSLWEAWGKLGECQRSERLQGILCLSTNNKEEFHRGEICLGCSMPRPDPADSSSEKTPEGTRLCLTFTNFFLKRQNYLNTIFCGVKETLVHSCESLWSCPTLCNPMDRGPPGSSVHGILQARILEWVAMPCSRGSSRPRDRTCVSYVYLHQQAGSLLPAPPGKP